MKDENEKEHFDPFNMSLGEKLFALSAVALGVAGGISFIELFLK